MSKGRQMSIQVDGEEMVRLPPIWGVLVKAAALCAISSTGLAFTWGVWITNKSFEHTQDIALLKQELRFKGGQNVSQNINVGSTDESRLEEAAKLRGYYNVNDVSAKLGKSERTVTELCSSGKIDGAYQPEGGRGWRIPLQFDICEYLPQTAAVSGN